MKSTTKLLGLLFMAFSAASLAKQDSQTVAEESTASPRLAIVIDDLGNSRFQQNFAELPGALTLALLPHTPYAERIAEAAQTSGKEVIIHMPMQPGQDIDAGLGTLRSENSKAEFIMLMEQAFMQLPQAVGMNNHMGSRLTALVEPMQWVMEQLSLRNFYFLDSRTTAATQAEQVARNVGLPVARRHVFLDNDPRMSEISARWDELIKYAKKNGEAIAIAHPHRTTYEFLQTKIPELGANGIKLVFASELAKRDHPAQTIELTDHKLSTDHASEIKTPAH